MQRHKHINILLVILLTTVITTASAAVLYRQKQTDKQQGAGNDDFESQFPITEYSAPEEVDPEKRAKRQAKSKKFNDKGGAIDPENSMTVLGSEWAIGLSSLPVAQSDAIVVGDVADAKAYLSEDKKTVYSEFTIKINEALKPSSSSSIIPNNSIMTTRQGGRVRFPSGHINMVMIEGQGMPRVGRQYILFLKGNDDSQDFTIILGYELRGSRIVLLDKAYPGHPITTNKGVDAESFLNKVKNAIAESSNQK